MRFIPLLLFPILAALFQARPRAESVAYQDVIDGVPTLEVRNYGTYESGQWVDPQLVVRRLKRGSISFTGLQFTFQAPTGSGKFDYYNGNDFGLSELAVVITPGERPEERATVFDCGVESDLPALPFSNCAFSRFGTGRSATSIEFWGPPGLPAHSHFELDLTDFPVDATVLVTAVAKPMIAAGTRNFLLVGALSLGTVLWLHRRRPSTRPLSR